MIHMFPRRGLEVNLQLMTLRTKQLLLMVFLLDFTNDIWTLPAPSRVFMDSFNMQHTLKWTPLKTSCDTTVLYSVQYQGDYERLKNDTWLDAPECQQIPVLHCDLTLDLGSDSDYVLRVQAQCGSQLSDWTSLRFNRKDTTLLAPEMKVTMVGDVLQVSIKKPLTATGRVTVWRKDEELQPVVHSMSDEQEVMHIGSLQEEVEYCVKAQVVLHTGVRSGFTDTHCVSVTGPGAPVWKKPTIVALTAVAMLGLLVGLLWFVVHCRPDFCKKFFEKVPLPSSLLQMWKMDTRVIVVPPMEPNHQENTSHLLIVSENVRDQSLVDSLGCVLVQMDKQEEEPLTETELPKTFSQTETAEIRKTVPADWNGSEEQEVLLPPGLRTFPSIHPFSQPAWFCSGPGPLGTSQVHQRTPLRQTTMHIQDQILDSLITQRAGFWTRFTENPQSYRGQNRPSQESDLGPPDQ